MKPETLKLLKEELKGMEKEVEKFKALIRDLEGGTPHKKRHRRTKAEIEALKKKQGGKAAKTPEKAKEDTKAA
jgi:hypothetical protein